MTASSIHGNLFRFPRKLAEIQVALEHSGIVCPLCARLVLFCGPSGLLMPTGLVVGSSDLVVSLPNLVLSLPDLVLSASDLVFCSSDAVGSGLNLVISLPNLVVSSSG